MVVNFPCRICHRAVARNHKAVFCDICEYWVHLKCNYLTKSTYEHLQQADLNWYCIKCSKDIYPFSNLSDENFLLTMQGKNFVPKNCDDIQIDLPPDLATLFKELNNLNMTNDFTDHCKYYTTSEINNINIKKKNITSYLHMNISSLPYHIDELHTLLNLIDIQFDFIAITESRLKKNQQSKINIEINNYTIKECPTEATKGGALLYVKNGISFRDRNDLKIYKKQELESIFIEIPNKKGKNDIVGCIYRHPSMSITDFNDNYISPLLEKLSFENKNITVLGDFNVNLLNHDQDNQTSEFINLMATGSLLPTITKPTRVTSRSKTLIDNIFSNDTSDNLISGNITTPISDHMAQFLLKTTTYPSMPKKRPLVYKRNYKNYNKDKFVLDIMEVNWDAHLFSEHQDVNDSLETFCDIINTLLDRHAPLKRVPIKKQTNKSKPWITIGLITSINKKIPYIKN